MKHLPLLGPATFTWNGQTFEARNVTVTIQPKEPLLLTYPEDRVRIPVVLAFSHTPDLHVERSPGGALIRLASPVLAVDRYKENFRDLIPLHALFEEACHNYRRRYRRRAPNDFRSAS